MKIKIPARKGSTLLLVSGLLVGCSSSMPSNSPTSQAAAELPVTQSLGAAARLNRKNASGAETNGLYVSQWYESAIGHYNLPDQGNQGPSCDVAAAKDVSDLGVDASGTLYVPEQLNAAIATFGPDCGLAGPVLTEPSTGAPAYPEDVAFNNAKHIVYVSNLYGPAANGDVAVFPKGATTPNRLLSESTEYSGFGVSVDSHGNVFQVAQKSYTTQREVIEWMAGKMPGVVLGATGFASPVGVSLDKNDNMLLFDPAVGVLKYAPPYSGAPSHTYKLKHYYAAFGKLNAKNTRLYVASAAGSSVDVYSYPDGKFLYSITAGLSPAGTVSGLAVNN